MRTSAPQLETVDDYCNMLAGVLENSEKSVEEIARLLHSSERTAHRYIEKLKDRGHSVARVGHKGAYRYRVLP